MDYEFNPGEIVTAVNRSSTRLTWPFNGVSHVLEPHQEKPMNITYVLYGVRRCPVMGTQDPAFEQQAQSLIGIKEYSDLYPCSPIEQSNAVEALDRSKLPADRQTADVVRVGWDAETQRLAGRNPLTEDAGFSGVMGNK